jgi:hypothetical protein
MAMGTKTFSGKSVWGAGALAAGLAFAIFGGTALAQQGYSHARIVRLSFTQGTVSIERPGSIQWEATTTNTPIQEGFALSTAADSYAEVEFENSSTARMGEQSQLDFTALELAPSGAKINRMELTTGYATFTVKPENGDVYEVSAGGATITPSGNSRFRVDLDQGAERVEVFKGMVDVSSPYGSSQLTQNDVLEIQPGTDQAYVVTRGITEDDWDKWVESRQQVLSAQYNRQGVQSPNPYPDYSSLYGWNDLTYYGGWGFVPGYGYGWCPYVGAGWEPYTYGSWDWYPGFGWTWISAEPWGWVPFHYGSWSFVAGSGWFWFPNGLGAWSPGLVTWYEGNGWVGWWPKVASGQGAACAAGNNCVIAVSTTVFQRGRMINPGDALNVHPGEGRSVPAPSIAPPTTTTLARGRILVSAPKSESQGVNSTAVGGAALAAGNENGLATSGRRIPRFGYGAPSMVLESSVDGATNSPVAAHTGIVFDARSGRFVNNPNAPETGSAAAGSPSARPVPAKGAPAAASPHASAPAQQPDHHFDFFGLFGRRNSPQTGSSSRPEAGAQARGGSAPSGGGARSEGSYTAPREAPAPRSTPTYSAPPPAPAPTPHFDNGSIGGGGGARSGGGGGRGGGRPH